MSHPTDETHSPDRSTEPEAEPIAAPAEASVSPGFEVEEQTPAGGPTDEVPPAASEPEPEPAPEPEPEPVVAAVHEHEAPKPAPGPVRAKAKAKAKTVATPVAVPEPVHAATTTPTGNDDDDEKPVLVWYVLKVQSSREDTIRDALERRVKIQGLRSATSAGSSFRPRRSPRFATTRSGSSSARPIPATS